MNEDREWVWTEEIIHKLETYDDLLEALKKTQWGCGCCGCPECGADELYQKGQHEAGCVIGDAIAKAEVA